jgi:hypothetical protein
MSAHPSGRRPGAAADGIDEEMLRVTARMVLASVDRLLEEGLRPQLLETLTDHVSALTAHGPVEPLDDAGRRAHAAGLRETLSVLRGPTSATLLIWMDEAVDPRP